MADARSIRLTDGNGDPLTSASPTWSVYADRSTAAARTPPALPVHLGEGVWAWLPTDADEQAGTVAVCDFGAGAYPRRASWAVHQADNRNQFWCVHVEAPDGSQWVGVWPDFLLYDDSLGNARTPPALVAISGDWVFSWAPSAADVAAGVEGFLAAPAGAAESEGWHFSSVPLAPFAFDSLVDNPARAVATYLAGVGALNLETPPGGTQTLTFGAGGNLTAGPMPAAEGLVGQFHVSVLGSGGPLAMRFGSGGTVYEANVSVRVRSKIDAFAHGQAVARACLRRMHRADLAGYVSCVARDAEPVYQGHDEVGHHQFVFGLDVTIVR